MINPIHNCFLDFDPCNMVTPGKNETRLEKIRSRATGALARALFGRHALAEVSAALFTGVAMCRVVTS
jgi:hypothetical protein